MMMKTLKFWLIGFIISFVSLLLVGGAIDLYEAVFSRFEAQALWITSYLSPKYILICLIGGFFVGKSIQFSKTRKMKD